MLEHLLDHLKLCGTARFGNEKSVELILPVSDAKASDNDGCTALIYAAEYGTEKSVELLLPVSDAKATDKWGYTALMQAAMKGNVKSMELLLPVSDINARDKHGKTALDYAKSSGNDQTVKLLQQHILSNPFSDPESPIGNSSQPGWVSPIIGLGLAVILSILCVLLRINEL